MIHPLCTPTQIWRIYGYSGITHSPPGESIWRYRPEQPQQDFHFSLQSFKLENELSHAILQIIVWISSRGRRQVLPAASVGGAKGPDIFSDMGGAIVNLRWLGSMALVVSLTPLYVTWNSFSKWTNHLKRPWMGFASLGHRSGSMVPDGPPFSGRSRVRYRTD